MSDHTPFKISLIIKRGWLLYRASLKSVFLFTFVCALVNQLINIYIQRFVVINNQQIEFSHPTFVIGSLVLVFVVVLLTEAIVMSRQNATLMSTKPADAYHQLKRRLPTLILAGFILGIGMILGLSFLVVPALVIGVLFYFIAPSILFSDRPFWHHFGHSVHLLGKSVLGVIGLIIFNLVITAAPAFIIHRIVGVESGSTFGIEELIIIAIQALIYPFIFANKLSAYHSLVSIQSKSKGHQDTPE